MGLDQVIQARNLLLANGGAAFLNAKYPDEFELYVCALELTDTAGKTLKYFIFPVNPSNLDETQPQITSIKKTLAGVTVLSTTTFVPTDISISGTFGRKFKILLGEDFTDFVNSFTSDNGNVTVDSFLAGTGDLFDKKTKTGYGCLKILESIVKEASVVDDIGPRRLIFYNPAFGTSYIVKPINFKISMGQENNMLHAYSLQLKGVADVTSLLNQQQLLLEAARLNATAYSQDQVNQTLQNLSSLLSQVP